MQRRRGSCSVPRITARHPARVGRPAVRVAVVEGGRPVLQNETVRDDSRLYGPPSLALQCELEVLRCVYTPGGGRGGGDTAPAGA
eukprot:COSAG02_NODE_2790_length_8022_cov_52.613783_2_plen_85_part_00